MGSIHYNVAPRYTGGSPAPVPEHVAENVARQEKLAYDRAIDGIHGEEEEVRAKAMGLDSIVEKRMEQATGWVVYDMCTGIDFFRPFALVLPRVRRTPRATAKRGEISLRDRACIYTHDTMYRGRVIDLRRYNIRNHKKIAYPGDTIVIGGSKRSITDNSSMFGIFKIDIVKISEVNIEL